MNVGQGCLVASYGLEGDAHAGPWHRQISLLSTESINQARERMGELGPGDFAENLTTEGIDLLSLPVGTRLRTGQGVLLEITQIGKKCHSKCAIYQRTGDCIMPREGLFAAVLHGGPVAAGDDIEVVAD